MQLNKEKFFAAYREQFSPLKQAQVDGLDAILDSIAADDAFDINPEGNATDLRILVDQVAYILATIKHECANQWMPIDEYGKGKGRKYGTPDPQTGKVFYGRGFVQLTWKANYERLGTLLGVDLVNKPELAKEPRIAWQITSEGMRKGLFTGKDLGDYINALKTDFVNARKIINGLDKSELIAGYARQFVKIINASLVG